MPTLIHGWNEQNTCAMGIEARNLSAFDDVEANWQDHGDGPELQNKEDFALDQNGRWFKKKGDAKRAATAFWRDRRDTAIYALRMLRKQ